MFGTPPSPRCAHSAVLIDGERILIYGGRDSMAKGDIWFLEVMSFLSGYLHKEYVPFILFAHCVHMPSLFFFTFDLKDNLFSLKQAYLYWPPCR